QLLVATVAGEQVVGRGAGRRPAQALQGELAHLLLDQLAHARQLAAQRDDLGVRVGDRAQVRHGALGRRGGRPVPGGGSTAFARRGRGCGRSGGRVPGRLRWLRHLSRRRLPRRGGGRRGTGRGGQGRGADRIHAGTGAIGAGDELLGGGRIGEGGHHRVKARRGRPGRARGRSAGEVGQGGLVVIPPVACLAQAEDGAGAGGQGVAYRRGGARAGIHHGAWLVGGRRRLGVRVARGGGVAQRLLHQDLVVIGGRDHLDALRHRTVGQDH